MSVKEVNRISILDQVKRKAMKQKRAAHILGISIRHVRRLVKAYRRDGASALVHKLRGIPSNHHADQKALDAAIATIRQRYADFSVTLAHEKLTELHSFPYSRETLRSAMMAVGIWKPSRQPIPVVHELRERRSAEGELVQVDGSPHAWFELRGPTCTLLVYIDDATGKLLHLMFAASETTNAYFIATKVYLEKHGKPLAFYLDRHGVFRVNTTKALTARAEDSNGKTQFGRAMDQLNIELIFAHSPQAKGRVEKVNQTLQDRLVKELRLQGISSMEEANRYLPVFIEDFNRRFAVAPRSSVNFHRPLTSQDILKYILVQKHTRRLSKQLTISYENHIYQITTDHQTYAMRHASVTVQEDAMGGITLWYQDKKLSYRIMTKHAKSEIVDSKHINLAVDQVKERVGVKPPPAHPWRQPQLYW